MERIRQRARILTRKGRLYENLFFKRGREETQLKRKLKEDFSDCGYEEKLRRENNLLRKPKYGHKGYKGGNEPSPWSENAVRSLEDN